MIEPAGRVRFKVLGPLEVWTGDGWSQVTASKWRALLAALLLHPGQLVPTDQLALEIWGENPPAAASNLVSVYVHRLRRLIGDAGGDILMTRAPGYQLRLAPGDVDSGRFAELLGQGRQALADDDPDSAAQLLTEALGWWRGRALADVVPTMLVSAEAQRLEDARIQALELRAEADLARGQHAQAVAELRRLVADYPLREKLWALLMRALVADGRQAEALTAYGQARETIADELGVDPGAELQRLYLQILNADVDFTAAAPDAPVRAPAAPEPVPPPAQLPAGIPDFTGRSEQMSTLTGLLAEPGEQDSPGAVRVVLVVGSGGRGKTTLAVHAAHQIARHFPDGQLYANLFGATQPASPADIMARFLRDLGVDGARIPVGDEERAALYRTRLAGRQVLVVLDDARDAAQVQPLLPGSSSCAVLITSRRRMPELVGCRVVDLEVLGPAESRTLFGKVVGEQRASAEPEATQAVLGACAGLPLAIRIAGARLAARGGWSVRFLADRLADERRRLNELRAGNLAVAASFEVSYAHLPGPSVVGGVDPAEAFRLLGLWTGPTVTLPAAAALIGYGEPDVGDALDVLVDAHLLETPGPDTYRFHDLLRVYAADRAHTEETSESCLDAITRILIWYLHSTETAARVISPHHARVPLDGPPPDVPPMEFGSLEAALAWCEDERTGLVAAVRLAADNGLHEAAWRIAAASMSFYFRRNHLEDWLASHQTGLASARAISDRRAEAWMLNNLGMASGLQHRPESVTYFEESLAIYRQLGDLRGESQAATNVANTYLELRQFGDALEAAERSVEIQRRAGKRYGEGVALSIMGSACRATGRFDESVVHSSEALTIFRGLGDQMMVADTLGDLGEAYLLLGRVNDALEALAEALTTRRSIGHPHGEAVTLRRLGQAQARAGEAAGARASLTEALRLFELLRDHVRAAEVRKILADMGD